MAQVGVEGQKKINNSSICIIGCGGLGTSRRPIFVYEWDRKVSTYRS